MTKLVAQHWQQADPPGLWITAIAGSVTLHLLVFWLARSLHINLLQQQYPNTAIPVEVIEIASQSQNSKTTPPSPTKPVRTQPPPHAQKSSTSALSRQPATSTTDSNAIAVAEKKTTHKSRTPTPTKPQSPKTPSPNYTSSFQFGQPKQPPLPTGNGEKILQAPANQLGQVPKQATPLSSSKPSPQSLPSQLEPSLARKPVFPSPTPGLIVTWNSLDRNEVIQLIQKGILKQDVPPQQLAEHLGTNTKEFSSLEINKVLEHRQVNLLASLVVDNTGQFQKAEVIGRFAPPDTLEDLSPPEKDAYQDFLNDFFQNEKFQAAQNEDGSRPSESNLVILIKIQRLAT
jgi:hypothetical protein